jgi:coenzyme F420-reducing hydrogenase alpha subunit
MKKTLELEHITKIEGHAKLLVKIESGRIKKVEMNVFEGARFFEGILIGKRFNEISHIASRICGVCSVVHSLAAVKAVENAYDLKVSKQTELLRELLNVGGMIQSHVLHLFFLTLPDYMNTDSALALAKSNRELLELGLRLKRLGNKIVFTIAGRDVHPIACVVGGFSRIPEQKNMDELLVELKKCRADALKTVKLFMALDFPDFSRCSSSLALGGANYFYPDRLLHCENSSCFAVEDYRKYFRQYFREGSSSELAVATSKEAGKKYFVGALARILNNSSLLSKESKKFVSQIKKKEHNPFMNVPAQAVEILEGINRAIDILSDIKLKEEKPVDLCIDTKKSGTCRGTSACEAPRGTLIHSYEFDSKGYCTSADIVTPTTLNISHLECSIKEFLPSLLNQPPDRIKKELEKLIRAYDPCISCSTHFLDIDIEQN